MQRKRLFGKKLSTEQAFWLCLVNGASPVAAALLLKESATMFSRGSRHRQAIPSTRIHTAAAAARLPKLFEVIIRKSTFPR